MRWGIHTIEDYHEATHGLLPEFYDKLIARGPCWPRISAAPSSSGSPADLFRAAS